MLGDELRCERKLRGWTRLELGARLGLDVSPQTLATWELGTRSVSVAKFIELCRALEVPAPELMARALGRVADPELAGELRVDLRAVIRDQRHELAPLRRWAHSRLNYPAAEAGSPRTARLSPAAVERMAELCGVAGPDLVATLRALGSITLAARGTAAEQSRPRPRRHPWTS